MLKQKKGPAFLLKTDNVKKEEFKEIIDWTADGTGFVFKNPTLLSEKVLPKYFKHSNMHSFIRQLNMYGFNKKRDSKAQNYYFHPMFKKGQRDGILQMQRKAQKKGTHRQFTQIEHDDVSIQLEQDSHEQNRTHSKMQASKVVFQNDKKQHEIDNSRMLANALQLNAMNKILILEQIYHLANISSNNLLTYQLNQQNEHNITSQRNLQTNHEVIQRFNFTKERYLKIMATIWDKVNLQLQKFSSFNESEANKVFNNQEKSQKMLKKTEVSIEKFPSRMFNIDLQNEASNFPQNKNQNAKDEKSLNMDIEAK